MGKLQIKVLGLTGELKIALTLIEAGGSDEIRPPKEVLDKAFAKLGDSKVLRVAVIEDCWVALRGSKPGLTLYHFYVPVELV